METIQNKQKEPSLGIALVPIIFLIILLSLNVYIFGEDSTAGSVQMVLILSTGIAVMVAMTQGVGWKALQDGMMKNVMAAMNAILILLLIGALAGTWLLSGIVPTIIYYGLKVIHPPIFLFAACLASAVISLATGSSWSTIATFGIALLGIGKALGFHEGLVAGAIISGAYFGDKMSPLSDTTNLAPAVAGTDLFTHIRYMIYTTGPAIVIAMVLYLILGVSMAGTGNMDQVGGILQALEQRFTLSGWLLLVPGLVIWMIIKKMPAAPALLVGALLGAVAALIFQPHIVHEVGSGEGSHTWESGYTGIMKALYTNVNISTENKMVSDLLASRGMAGMLSTVWLIICAMCFGGVMEASGFLQKITATIIKRAQKTWSLIGSTAGTCLFFNVTASDQYMAIVIPGRMFSNTYKKRNLKPEVLSRTLEDTATVTSVLVPWNTCGATQSSVLGVSTLLYAPFCFFNILSPLMTLAFAIFNVRIRRYTTKELETETAGA